MKLKRLNIEFAAFTDELEGSVVFENEQGSGIRLKLNAETCRKVLKNGLWEVQFLLDQIKPPYLYTTKGLCEWLPGEDERTPEVSGLLRERAQ